MRIYITLLCTLLSGSLFAETVVIEASQDNSLYQSAQGALSNGAGTFLFAGQTDGQGIRRALVAFKDLSAIPPGATINSVKFHLYLNKQNSAATMLRLMRVTSDWGEGASDASGAEGQGAAALTGDATWNHTFFDNMTWTTPGGDFNPTVKAQIPVDAVGAYAFESSAALVADVEDWIANPEGNFGWILLADESVVSARRFAAREGGNEDRRPRLEVNYTMGTDPIPVPVPGSDWSGPWFDPDSDGEGFLIFNTPAGWLIYYFGYSADNDRLWLVSNLVEIESLEFGKDYEFTMLVGTPGSFEMPTPSADLETWGSLKVSLDDCDSGLFMLDGADGMKSYDVVKIVGIEGTSCAVQ